MEASSPIILMPTLVEDIDLIIILEEVSSIILPVATKVEAYLIEAEEVTVATPQAVGVFSPTTTEAIIHGRAIKTTSPALFTTHFNQPKIMKGCTSYP